MRKVIKNKFVEVEVTTKDGYIYRDGVWFDSDGGVHSLTGFVAIRDCKTKKELRKNIKKEFLSMIEYIKTEYF